MACPSFYLGFKHEKNWQAYDNQQNNKSISCCPFDTIGSMKSNGMFVSSDHDSLQCCRCWKTNWEFPWTTTKKRSETLTNSLNGKECWCMLLSLLTHCSKMLLKMCKFGGKNMIIILLTLDGEANFCLQFFKLQTCWFIN